MKKKTIGKFISVLRRAKGLTQRELGEMLFVSDKTVSRWECDEALPELALVPLIADIFEITADELLRGERSKSQDVNGEALSLIQKKKSLKQLSFALVRRIAKFKNLSMISIGIALLTLIGAAICHIGFSKGILGLLVSGVMCFMGIGFQVILWCNFKIEEDSFEGYGEEQIVSSNNNMVQFSLKMICILLVSLAFVFPIAKETYYHDAGITIKNWVLYGTACAFFAFIVIYMLYTLFINSLLQKKRILSFTDKEKIVLNKKRKVLITIFTLALIVVIALQSCITVFEHFGAKLFAEGEEFDNSEDLKQYLEKLEYRQYPKRYKIYEVTHMSKVYRVRGEVQPIYGMPKIENAAVSIYDDGGKLIYGFNPSSAIFNIDFSHNKNGESGFPIKIYTCYEMDEAFFEKFLPVILILDALSYISVVIFFAVYFVKTRKIK